MKTKPIGVLHRIFQSTAQFPRVRNGLLAGAVLGGLLLAGCGHGDTGAPQAGAQRPAPRVAVATAIAQDVPVYLDEIGKTIAIDSVSIIPQVGGKLIAAHVEDGATVKKGDLLFEIDPRPFEAALASANAAKAQSKADLELAQLDYNRAKNIAGSNAMTQQEMDTKKNAVDVGEAKIKASDAQVEMAQLNLEYAKIYAPLSGRAGAVLVDPGNIIKENDIPILVIQQLDPIYAEFTVPENDLGTVRKHIAAQGLDLGLEPGNGLKVEVDVPGNSSRILTALGNSATTQPGQNKSGPRAGTLTFLDNSVTSGSGTVKVRATVPNADRYFWPGQFVNVRLVLTTRKAAVLIPAVAQQIGQQGPFVYVVGPDGTAALRPIVPGQRQGDLLMVDSGVQAGERVIVNGQMMVIPNAKVDVLPDATPAPAANATTQPVEAVSQGK